MENEEFSKFNPQVELCPTEENDVFQEARRRFGDAVGGLPLGKC